MSDASDSTPPDLPRKYCIDCDYPLDHLPGTTCPECGRAFDLQDPTTYRSALSRPVKLYSTNDATEANLLRNALEHEGVRAVVIDTKPGFSHLAIWHPNLIWVSADELDQARAVLEQFRAQRAAGSRDDPRDPPWTCPNCGEAVDGHFDVCWNCEQARPGINDEFSDE